MDSIIIFGAKYLIIAVGLAYLYGLWQANPRDRKSLVAAMIVAAIAAVVIGKIAGKLYYDPRPFITHHVKPLISHSMDNGFPSDHTLLGVTVASVIYLYRRKLGILAITIALLVGVARVAAHVHSPIDIIGGAVIGGLAAWIGSWTAEKYLDRKLNAASAGHQVPNKHN